MQMTRAVNPFQTIETRPLNTMVKSRNEMQLDFQMNIIVMCRAREVKHSLPCRISAQSPLEDVTGGADLIPGLPCSQHIPQARNSLGPTQIPAFRAITIIPYKQTKKAARHTNLAGSKQENLVSFRNLAKSLIFSRQTLTTRPHLIAPTSHKLTYQLIAEPHNRCVPTWTSQLSRDERRWGLFHCADRAADCSSSRLGRLHTTSRPEIRCTSSCSPISIHFRGPVLRSATGLPMRHVARIMERPSWVKLPADLQDGITSFNL